MAVTDTQAEILAAVRAAGQCSKQELVTQFGGRYYCNADKHIGDILSRMVNRGLLIRVKRGLFKVGAIRAGKTPAPAPLNQITLF